MTRIGVAVVAFLAAGAAVAQPPRGPDPAPAAPLAARLPAHVADPAVAAELKLTPDQVKALTPVGTAKSNPLGTPAAATRVKDALTPEQYARAVQLMAQDALRTGRGSAITPAALVAVPAATFRRYPELAAAAKLTREQKRRVSLAPGPAAPGGPPQPSLAAATYGGLPGAEHVVLAPDQTAALAAFVGPLRATPFVANPAPVGPPTGPTFTRPTPAAGPLAPVQRVMLAVNNRGELKLTDEQAETLTTLLNASRGVPAAPGADGAPVPARVAPPSEIEGKLTATLTAAQQTRLGQIELWQQVPAGEDDGARFDIPRVASEVGLTPEQRDEVRALRDAHRAGAAKAAGAAKSAAALKAALAAARADVAAGVAKLLTQEQAAALRDLFGPEYRGAGAGGPGTDIFRRIRAAGFGNYQFEIMLMNRFPNVADDLKLTEEQKTSLAAAEAAFNQQFRQVGFNYELPEKELARQMGERSKAMQKVFDDHFNPDQKKRFRELCVQLRQQLNAQQVGGGGGGYPASGTPGVADELKLTPEQRQRIVDTGEEDEVLTPDQQAHLRRLAGTPIPGGFNFGGPARGRPVPPSARVALLHAGGAHADLKLTPDQAYLIAEVIEAHAAELRPAAFARNPEGGGFVEPPPPDAVEEAVRACEAACDGVLTPPQRARLGQLTLQVAAHAGLTATFARPEVAAKLAFTPVQRAALDDLAADFRARVALVNALPTSAGWPEVKRVALDDMRAKARDRMTAVLTPAQAAAWRELTGAPSPAVAAAAPPGAPGRDP